jgi:hypothetical protein
MVPVYGHGDTQCEAPARNIRVRFAAKDAYNPFPVKDEVHGQNAHQS